MDFEKISQQIRALDKPEKLKILALLAEEGRKSISSVARELDIHFSTTHKYLEQLEAAELVYSKTVKEDRLKRYFYIKDFNIELSPQSLTAATRSEKKIETFKVITDEGEEGWFDEKVFTQMYLEAGVPNLIVNIGLDYIQRHKYGGITILELRNLFEQAMRTVMNLVETSTRQLVQQSIKKRTYISVLNYVNPRLIEKHLRGDIFIQNLWRPRLFDFVHDIRALGLHGLDGIAPTNLKALLTQITDSIKLANTFGVKSHCLDSINYFLAPYWDGDIEALKDFFNKLKENVHLGIDLGEPRFAKEVPVTFWAGSSRKRITYSEFNDAALDVAKTIIKLTTNNTFPNIIPTCKLWSADHWDIVPESKCYVANMSNNWQGLNASYIGAASRFDSNWRGWMASVRVGEVENIVINLPRLAKQTGPQHFLEKLEMLMQELASAYGDIAELTNGRFFKNKNIWRKSAQTAQWAYLPTEYSQYAISLIGLNEAVQILSKKPLEENVDLGLHIVKTCSDVIKKQVGPMRLALKEESSKRIIDRFVNLDKDITNLSTYTPGVICKSPAVSAAMHSDLNGGHCIKTNKETLMKLNDFGLAELN